MYTETDVERADRRSACSVRPWSISCSARRIRVGETIRVNNEPCVVVGVLDVKGQSATGQDQDDSSSCRTRR